MILISYTNARGEEVILDDTEKSFLGELYGREGCEAPELEYEEVTYADGSTQLVAINMKPRDVTLYFWAPTDRRKTHLREKMEDLKQTLIQTGVRDDEWGKLMIRRPDGRKLYLTCAYVGGLDEFIRVYPRLNKFSLTFHAESPYFYDGFELSVTSKQDDRAGYLMFATATICDTLAEAQEIAGNDPNNYFRISGTTKYYAISKDDSLYMNDAVIYDTQNEAMAETGETTAGTNWWTVNMGGGVTKYYTLIKSNVLYMQSAEASTLDSLYIQAEKVYPDIIINGPAANIVLTNHTTGRKIELDPAVKLDNNQKIYICTSPRKRSITRGSKTGTSLIPYLSIDSTLDWWLEHGNNDIELSNSTTTPVTYMQFSYTERYLSAQ